MGFIRKDDLYFYVLIFISGGLMVVLYKTFVKFFKLSALHIIDVCRRFVASLSTTFFHLGGTMIVFLILVIGVFLIIRAVFSVWKNYKQARLLIRLQTVPSKRVIKLVKKHKIKLGNLIIVKDEKRYAFVFGVIKAKLILSSGLVNKLNDKELEAVILHEIYHLRQGHPFKFMVGKILSAGLFFMPIVKWLNFKFHLVAEKEADGFVCQRQKTGYYLKSALIKSMISPVYLYPNLSGAVKDETVGNGSVYRLKNIVSLIIGIILIGLYFMPVWFHDDRIVVTNMGPNLAPCHHLV